MDPLKIAFLLVVFSFIVYRVIVSARKNDPSIQGSILYHHEFFVEDQSYQLRFMLPSGWQSDDEIAEELEVHAYLHSEPKPDAPLVALTLEELLMESELSPQKIIKKFEADSLINGAVKLKDSEGIKSYDDREISVLQFKMDDYTTITACMPLKEAPGFFIHLNFQISSSDENYIKKQVPTFVNLLKSVKFTLSSIDKKELENYAMEILKEHS